ncbi:hypothetical protein LK459_07765 [Gordonia otitidis]|uniref:hypothetical protein n=1 Tax=Gordonia otitidis TaxID=249058 RepID=UPI001D15D574|nr:hypothetical protein [Gordonia otitidis]UEA60714.1 hypothetical protein LK459_07765 [Gordonia otitidis]
MSILDNAPRSASPNPAGDHGPEIETSQLETPERTDTGDFPVLDAPVGETVPSADNHEEHSTLLIAGLLPLGCLWVGITVDSLFASLALTATSVAVFATLTLGVLVASALHDGE